MAGAVALGLSLTTHYEPRYFGRAVGIFIGIGLSAVAYTVYFRSGRWKRNIV